MCHLIPAEESEPLFLVHEKNDRLALSAGQIRRLLKKWCIAVSINPKSYTPHCLHRGGLNWAHNAELTQESLKVLGDWSSQAYQRYIDIGFEARVKSGKKMKQFIDGNVSTSLQAPEKKMWWQFLEKHDRDEETGMAGCNQEVVPVHQLGGEVTAHQGVSHLRWSHLLHYSQTVNNQARCGQISMGGHCWKGR